MTSPLSLRLRLTLIILLPLLAIAVLVGFWQMNNARQTAADVFEQSLLFAALAVSNDVALSGGDVLSQQTEALLQDTSGGRVFYHVYAPDGVIVAGFATPPVGIPSVIDEESRPRFFEAVYQGRPVSGVRLQNRQEIEGFSGIFTTTVWQDTTVRTAFVGQLVERALITIVALIASVAFVVWFGVRIGLRPLLDLEEAIELRSSDELTPIRRAVPEEVKGIVATLNTLFDQVSRSMTAQGEFISNAAHQLRNPIAAVLSLAEAVNSAPNGDVALERSADLLEAAQETADLSQKLLSLERAKNVSPSSLQKRVDLGQSLEIWLPAFRAIAGPGVSVELSVDSDLPEVVADETMIREAISNLIDNAKRHGGPGLSQVAIRAARRSDALLIDVADNGVGIPAKDIDIATERFAQLSDSAGSGLGLPIVKAIFESHQGDAVILPQDQGTAIRMTLPV